MLIPPNTGDRELDYFLQQVALQLAVAPAQPYYNNDNGIVRNLVTNRVLNFLFRYLHIKFADDNIGTNFSDSPTGRYYYGYFNSEDSTESTDYGDYTWVEVTGGFGSDELYFRNLGGRGIDFFIGSTSPGIRWALTPTGAIDLDDLLGDGSVDSDALADGSVTTIKLANEAVTTGKLDDEAVTSAKLAPDSVQQIHMTDGSVGTNELLNGSVTGGKLATTGTPTSSTYLNGAMQWVEPQTGWFLEQTILTGGTHIVTLSDLGGHFYKSVSASPTVYLEPGDASPIGSTITLINGAASGDIYFTFADGDLFEIGTGAEDMSLELAPSGRAFLTKVSSTRWTVDAILGTLSAVDFSDGFLTTESGDYLTTESGDKLILE